MGWKPVNDRILTARFKSCHSKTTIIQVYALTEEAEEEEKDNFYNSLQDTLNKIPKRDRNMTSNKQKQGWLRTNDRAIWFSITH